MKFCGQCTAALALICPKCHAENPPGFKFCGQCTAALIPPAARPRAEESAVTIRQSDDAAALDGERKTVTALFADIKGSTELEEAVDPEEARRIVEPALKLMVDAVRRYEGYVVQSTGDGIFAIFGAPVAHEDHPQRALFAALRIHDDNRRYADKLRAEGRSPVQIRIGVDTGEVVMRALETGGRTEYTPIGHPANLASRMQSLANPGSTVISEATRKLVEGYFALKSLGSSRVKGIAEPVNLHEVTGVGPLRTKLQRAALRGFTRFVGRDAEMAALDRAAEFAKSGHGQIVAVVGEAGVGKSRLFFEFNARHQVGWKQLEAFSVSHGRAASFTPVIELLKNYFGINEGDETRIRREKVAGRVAMLDRALEDALPYVFGLLGLNAGDDPLAGMDANIRRRRTLDAIVRVLIRESLAQPLIVVFEDLHWIDDETQALLNLLAESIGEAAILLALNYRPEYRHDWGTRASFTQIRLEPLKRESADEMLAGMLGNDPSVAPLRKLILDKSDATPFFIEEMVQTLFEEGVVTRNGVVRATRSITEINLPPTVNGVLAARIDRLAANEKELLQTLAVIGDEFALRLVREVVKIPSDDLDSMLTRLQEAEFIYEQPAKDDIQYHFKHALTREVAYNSILTERRKVLRERAGLALESLHASRLDDHLEKLAYHYSHSDNVGKAIEYLKRAGKQAMLRSAHLAATGYLQRGLGLLVKLEETPERDRQELELQAALGPSLVQTKGDSAPEVEAVYGRIAELGERTGQTKYVVAVQSGLFRVYMTRGQYETAQGFADRVLNLAERSKNPAELLNAHTLMGINLFWKGDLTNAHDHFERAAAHIDPPRQRHMTAIHGLDSATSSVGYAALPLWMMGYPDQALQRTRRALSLARERDHLSSTVVALHYASIGHLYRGETQTARELAEAGLALANEHGLELWAGLHNQVLGQALAQSGREPEGIEHMEKGISAYAGTRARRVVGQPGELAYAHGRIGQGTKALKLIEEQLALASACGAHSVEPELHRIKGELLLLQDHSKPAEAERCFRTAIEKAQCIAAKSWELRAVTSLTRLLRNTGRRDEARAMLADIYDWFTEGFDTADLKDAKALLEELSD